MNKHPFLSITTATYNREKTLSRCFDCLQRQTFKDFEWIIGDDGSTDNTENLVTQFQKKAKFPIKYVKGKHAGKTAIYVKIDACVSGKYKTYLDSDDEFFSKKTLEDVVKCIKALSQNNTFTGIGGCFINQKNQRFPSFKDSYYDINKETFFEYLTKQPDLLNYWSVVKTVPLKKQSNLDFVKEDIPAYPEIVQNAHEALSSESFNIRIFNKPFYKYYMNNPDSITVTLPNTSIGWYEDIEMVNLFYKYGLNKKYLKYIHQKLNCLAGKHYRIKGFKTTFLNLKNKRSKLYFLYAFFLRKYLKYLFFIDSCVTKTKYYVLGIKIYTQKAKRGT